MAKEGKGFYESNTTEITLNDQKVRVNKFEAEALKEKLARNKKAKK
jgi:hypothetical protein